MGQVQGAEFRGPYEIFAVFMKSKEPFIFLTNLCVATAAGKPHLPYVGDKKKETASMKIFLAGAALAAALASPAVAQTANHYTVPSARYAPNGHHEYDYP